MVVIGLICGFGASRALFKQTHEPGFPELGRYAIGELVIAGAMKLAGIPDKFIEKYLLISGAVGIGVAIARWFQ